MGYVTVDFVCLDPFMRAVDLAKRTFQTALAACNAQFQACARAALDAWNQRQAILRTLLILLSDKAPDIP